MKRTIFLTALAVTLALFMACGDLEPTRPDLDVLKSQWAPERTNANSQASTVYGAWETIASSMSLTVGKDEYVLDFNGNLKNATYAVDLVKITDRASFEAKLKEILIFSSYARDGQDLTELKPAALTALTYSVIEWKDFKAKIKFAGLTDGLSSSIEVRIDPAKFTHHGGLRYDYNNDGIYDEYDTWTRQVNLLGTTDLNFYYVEYDFQAGTIGSPNVTPEWVDSPKAKLAFGIRASDDTNYSGLNEFFKLQKFSKERGWENTGIAGTWDTDEKGLVFNLSGAVNGDFYRIKSENYKAAIDFRGKVMYGVAQKLIGSWNPSAAGSEFGQWMAYKAGDDYPDEISSLGAALGLVPGALSSDAHGKNVTVTLALQPGVELPDPNEAIRNGIIKFGYLGSAGAWDWNRIVFFPNDKITVETYRNDGEAVTAANPADRWRILYPAEYKVASHMQYVFINNEYKTMDGTKQFGNIDNTDLILKEGGVFRTFYERYQLTTF